MAVEFLPPNTQTYIVCTSSTRPSSPFIGLLIYETDTQRWLNWEGGKWIGVKSETLMSSGTGSSSFSTETTQATLSIPDQGCEGIATVFGSLRLDRSVVSDAWDIRLKDGSTTFETVSILGGPSAITLQIIGDVSMAAGSGKTINMTAVRASGTGTGTTYTHGTGNANRLRATFVPT